ncbi:MAG: DHA2 family efflux MFS transporter permease subunit [Acidimicrobiales bacterium]
MRYSSSAGRWVIAATVLGSGMAAIDSTVVGIALPTIGREFHSSFDVLQWVVTGYTLTLASLLLISGSLGDRYGRRLIFCIGVVWFTLSSAACAAAPGTTTLVVVRVLQGIGAALLTPGSLAIIQSAFDEEDRGRAIGAWSGLGGVATAAGPLLGGYLIAAASWRWIFFINVPIGVIVLAISVRHVPESHDPTAVGRLDMPGAVLATGALASLTYSLIEGPATAWNDSLAIAMLVIGLAAAAAFVVVERATQAPMLPPRIFRSRQFTVTNSVTFIVYAALGGALFLLPVVLQVVDRYTPLESGISLLPLTVVMLLLSAGSGRLAARIGPRLQMSVGPVIVGAGLALFVRVTGDSSYISGVLPAVVVFGLGLATTVAPLTTTALGSLSDEHSGLASAVNNDVARVGTLIAVAVLPPLAGISGADYLRPADLSHGFHKAILIAAFVCAAGGALAAAGIRNPSRKPPVEGAIKASAPAVECFHCALDASPLVAEHG